MAAPIPRWRLAPVTRATFLPGRLSFILASKQRAERNPSTIDEASRGTSDRLALRLVPTPSSSGVTRDRGTGPRTVVERDRREPRQPRELGPFETDRTYLEGLAIRISPRLSFWTGLTVNSLRISGPIWSRTNMV